MWEGTRDTGGGMGVGMLFAGNNLVNHVCLNAAVQEDRRNGRNDFL